MSGQQPPILSSPEPIDTKIWTSSMLETMTPTTTGLLDTTPPTASIRVKTGSASGSTPSGSTDFSISRLLSPKSDEKSPESSPTSRCTSSVEEKAPIRPVVHQPKLVYPSPFDNLMLLRFRLAQQQMQQQQIQHQQQQFMPTYRQHTPGHNVVHSNQTFTPPQMPLNLDINSYSSNKSQLSATIGSDGAPRKQRTVFQPWQIDQMEKQYQRSKYIVGGDRDTLAKALQLEEAQVRVWFQNRRSKGRKNGIGGEQHSKMEQQALYLCQGP